MLKLVPEATFKIPVSVPVPGQEADTTIKVSFAFLDKETLHAYLISLDEREDAESLAEIVRGWEGVDTPYSTDNLAQLLKAYPMAAVSFFQAFRNEILKAKQGN